ncbi:unnamed protein product [Spirodela intermedia]|uniref:Uncharacterized protein n=1 Tax=Spirodela intermedia TaxID=51605 RepID=A0A7I8J9C3_SPIIN|nr:unnamed protein product [Spirodela intermedia]CAA6666043.1 unnamed protein product [Spirodela intermedia]
MAPPERRSWGRTPSTSPKALHGGPAQGGLRPVVRPQQGAIDDAVAEVVEAKCECCGMSEECTPQYIRRVRDRFCGRWVCGLCSEAVKEEVEKKGVGREEAVGTHMSVCARFNSFGRTYPVLYQAEAMREMLKRSNSRSKSTSPRDKATPG